MEVVMLGSGSTRPFQIKQIAVAVLWVNIKLVVLITETSVLRINCTDWIPQTAMRSIEILFYMLTIVFLMKKHNLWLFVSSSDAQWFLCTFLIIYNHSYPHL